MKWPSLKEIARELKSINANVEAGDKNEYIDVRLQVYEDGNWIVRVGDVSYDPDHHGYWSASSVPGVYKGRVRRFNSTTVARDLIQEAKDDAFLKDGEF